MQLSNYTIQTLRDVVIGDSQIQTPRLSGRKITDLFNSFCSRKEVYPADWASRNSEANLSRKQYAEKRLHELNGTYQLTQLIERLVHPVYFEHEGFAYDKNSVEAISQILTHDGYRIEVIAEMPKIVGDVPPDEIKAEIHFEEIQGRILEQVNAAKYVVWVAMAWFTDKDLMRALYEKQKQGLNVEVVIFEDDINLRWGILDPEKAKHFTIHKIRYADSTKMHNKFCVIDLKTVIHGSYNWTDKARYNNETVEIVDSREFATAFADEFIRLKLTKSA